MEPSPSSSLIGVSCFIRVTTSTVSVFDDGAPRRPRALPDGLVTIRSSAAVPPLPRRRRLPRRGSPSTRCASALPTPQRSLDGKPRAVQPAHRWRFLAQSPGAWAAKDPGTIDGIDLADEEPRPGELDDPVPGKIPSRSMIRCRGTGRPWATDAGTETSRLGRHWGRSGGNSLIVRARFSSATERR